MIFKKFDEKRKTFIVDIANCYINDKNATMRSMANTFLVSKSFIAYVFSNELMEIDENLYDAVRDKAKFNIRERAKRGAAMCRKNKKKKEVLNYGNS